MREGISSLGLLPAALCSFSAPVLAAGMAPEECDYENEHCTGKDLHSKDPLLLATVSCVDEAASAKLSKKRLRSAAEDACGLLRANTAVDTPSPPRSLRRCPKTPDIAPPPCIRPRRLSFGVGAHAPGKSSNFTLEPQANSHVEDGIQKKALKEPSEKADLLLITKRRQSPRFTEKDRSCQNLREEEVQQPPTPLKQSKKRKNKSTLNRRKKEPTIKKTIKVLEKEKIGSTTTKHPKRKWLNHVVVDRIKFNVGDDVYVRRTEEDVNEEAEGCLACGKTGKLIECDGCSGGVHLKCINPPVDAVPEGSWYCFKCAPTMQCNGCSNGGEAIENASGHTPRTAREMLLASKLWAARIEKLWRDVDGSYLFKGRWYVIPEETAVGRQPHNLRRELFRTDQVDENEVASILRQCFVLGPQDFQRSGRDGDDVFLCEYAYDTRFQTFKRISDIDNSVDQLSSCDDEVEGGSDFEDDLSDDDGLPTWKSSSGRKVLASSLKPLAANARSGRMASILRVGAKTIPQTARGRPATPFERAKAALRLTATPDSLPCREKEMKEITAFVSDAVTAGDNSLGHCLYISGVPGTGKTATVLEVMQNIRRGFEEKSVNPYRFVEINGLRLTSPEHLYTVLHEALTGQHVGWKKALHLLDERFSNPKPSRRVDGKPCILLVDELDLLVTRNQSVLYNVFDWPTRPHSRLFVIGIANTMDLPERLLPRIASRMGLLRVSFSPYTHEQLQKIISSRLEAINAFEKQAVEFASRKVAAVSGDARRALELCRRSVEIAEVHCHSDTLNGGSRTSKSRASSAKVKLVGMKDVEEAIKEMFQAPHIKIMGRCPKHAKIFLVAMVYEQHKTGMVETMFEKVATTYTFLCRNNSERPLDWDTLLFVGCILGSCRLLICEPGSCHRLQKLQLNFPTDDVSFALKSDTEVPWIGKYL